MELAKLDFADPTTDLSAALDLCDTVEPLIKAIREHAKAQILSGTEVQGWKVVQGRRTRSWANKTQAALLFDYDQWQLTCKAVFAWLAMSQRKPLDETLVSLEAIRPTGA